MSVARHEPDRELAECERVIRNRSRLEQVARSGLDAMPTELTTLLGEYDRRGAELERLRSLPGAHGAVGLERGSDGEVTATCSCGASETAQTDAMVRQWWDAHGARKPSSWAQDMRSMLGCWVTVTLSADPLVSVSGVLCSFTDDGEVALREDGGSFRWSWPNLSCAHSTAPGGVA